MRVDSLNKYIGTPFLGTPFFRGVVILLWGGWPLLIMSQPSVSTVKRVHQKVDTFLKHREPGLWEDYTRLDTASGLQINSHCLNAKNDTCAIATHNYHPMVLTQCDIYHLNLQDGPPQEYVAVLNIAPIVSWNNYLLVFTSSSGQVKLVDWTGIDAKRSYQKTRFRQLTGNSTYEILGFYDQSPSTYRDAGVEIYQLHQDSLYPIFETETMFYDWKHYGKRFYEMGDQEDSLGDDEAYRKLRSLRYADRNDDGTKEIQVDYREDIVQIPEQDKNQIPEQQYNVLRNLAQQERIFKWDPRSRKYKRHKEQEEKD